MASSVYPAVDAFLAGLVAGGVTHAVISPGSRSTPLALPARLRDDLAIEVVLDERSAAFAALGRAKTAGIPVALICTSGTAGANYHPAVIEARQTRVPLVILTADRPPEVWGWDAGQTIDQVHLFGNHAKAFTLMPVGGFPSERAERTGFRAAVTARSLPAGPVHVNWPFREPLEPDADWREEYHPTRSSLRFFPPSAAGDPGPIEQALVHERGLIVAGPMGGGKEAAVAIGATSRAAGWPVVADPLSQLRSSSSGALILDAADHMFGSPAAGRLVPDVVLRLGRTPTSKAFRLWLERTNPPEVILVDPAADWSDPSALITSVVACPPEALPAPPAASARSGAWAAAWMELNERAAEIVTAAVAEHPMLELGVTRTVAEHVPAGSALVVASSMPVRDLDMAMRAGDRGLRVFANRGANGIDGTISTAVGVAQTSGPTTVLIGDLAFLHDLGGLVAAAQRRLDLTLVVLNNHGGGIFEQLPIAAWGEEVHFEELFLTPHAADFSHAAAMVGAVYERVTTPARLTELLARSGGLRVLEVTIDRAANTAQLKAIRTQIGEALS